MVNEEESRRARRRNVLLGIAALVVLAAIAKCAISGPPDPPEQPAPTPPQPKVTVVDEGRDDGASPATGPAAMAPRAAPPLEPPPAPTPPADPQDPPTGARPRGSVLVEGERRSDGPAPEAEGHLDKEAIQTAIRAVKPAIAECYEKALAHDPDLSGTVTVDFTIEAVDGGGGVTAGEVRQTDMNAPFFEACVLKGVVDVPFPAPEGGGVVKVSYPFRFESHDHAD